MKTKAILCFLLVSLSIQFANAQTKSGRPKIGLTLSGGGAKGLAHIGILQAIDKAGLKIDFITGTSMGSVIGGLYAAGYSGDSIEKLSRPLDWGVLLSGSPQLNQISIEEKSEYQKYALTLPLERGKLKMGRGAIEGQELWLTLSRLFAPVYNITDFSKLSIPFKCIGTNLENGDAVEMDHGNIVNAIRASMAIPTVFTPVKYDDKLLVDGGVVNNLPVSVVKKMGADYVIGVNLNSGLIKADSLNTGLDILLQIVFFKDASIFEQQKAQCDLFITPNLKGHTTGDFDGADSIIDLGIETGKLYYPYFKKLVDSLDALYGKNDFTKDRLPKNAEINISKFTAEGFKNTTPKFFFGMLDLESNKNHSYEEVSEAIKRVHGSRYYNIIRFNYLKDSIGKTEMHFHVTESPLSAIKVALNYNNFTGVGLILNLTVRDLLFKESRALVSGSISENPQIYAEYYKFINRNRTARVVLDYYFQDVEFPVYDNFRLYQTLHNTYKVYDVQLQQNINRFSYFGIGQQYNNSKIKTKETPSLIYNGQNKFWYSYISYVLNTTNQKHFATKGWNVKVKAGYAYSQEPQYEYTYDDSNVSSDSVPLNANDYVKFIINATHYSELNSKFSWSQNLSLAFISENNIFAADKFVAGGVNDIILNQVSFSGLNVSEVKTGSMGSLQFALQYKLSKKAYLTGRVNAALYNFQGIGLENLSAKNNLLTGYGLTYGYSSPLGPLEVTVMYCDQDAQVRNYINIGYTF